MSGSLSGRAAKEADALLWLGSALLDKDVSLGELKDGRLLTRVLLGQRQPTALRCWADVLQWVNQCWRRMLPRVTTAVPRWESNLGTTDLVIEALAHVLLLAFMSQVSGLATWNELMSECPHAHTLEMLVRLEFLRLLDRMPEVSQLATATRSRSAARPAHQPPAGAFASSDDSPLSECISNSHLTEASIRHTEEIRHLTKLKEHYKEESERHLIFKQKNELLHKQLVYYVEVKNALEERCLQAEERIAEMLAVHSREERASSRKKAEVEELQMRVKLVTQENAILQQKLSEVTNSANSAFSPQNFSQNGEQKLIHSPKILVSSLTNELAFCYSLLKMVIS